MLMAVALVGAFSVTQHGECVHGHQHGATVSIVGSHLLQHSLLTGGEGVSLGHDQTQLPHNKDQH